MEDDSKRLKQFPKKCIFDEKKICDNCCECFVCVLDPSKECNGCGKCIQMSDIEIIPIETILLYYDSKKKKP